MTEYEFLAMIAGLWLVIFIGLLWWWRPLWWGFWGIDDPLDEIEDMDQTTQRKIR